MDNKKCLHCKKEYEPKKDTSKYCSDSCRVMWNRKNGSKGVKVNKDVQMQVLVSTLMEKLDKVVFVQPTTPESFDGPDLGKISYDEPKWPIGAKNAENAKVYVVEDDEPKELIMQRYIEERYETDQDTYPNWLRRLMADERLSNRDKEICKTAHI